VESLEDIPPGPKPNPRYFFWSGNGDPKSAVADWQRSYRRLFKSADIQTQDNLRQRIPDPPVRERPHVIKVRPLATLPVGSCYALRSNGSWGLFQVQLPE
jgi:hypothetical protein